VPSTIYGDAHLAAFRPRRVHTGQMAGQVTAVAAERVTSCIQKRKPALGQEAGGGRYGFFSCSSAIPVRGSRSSTSSSSSVYGTTSPARPRWAIAITAFDELAL